MNNEKVAFIGTGRMATALIKNLIINSYYTEKQIIATHHNLQTLQKLINEFNINITSSNKDAIKQSKIIFLCVRPQQFQELAKQIKSSIHNNHTIVSIAIGVPISWLRTKFPNCNSILHVHPSSTLIANCPGISFISPEIGTSKFMINKIKNIFISIGDALIVEEKEIEKYAVFAGCSPAFLCRFAEIWLNLAVENNINYDIALKITINMFKSILYGVSKEGLSFNEIKSLIATPNGVTENGLKIFNNGNLYDTLKEVTIKSKNKIDLIKELFK